MSRTTLFRLQKVTEVKKMLAQDSIFRVKRFTIPVTVIGILLFVFMYSVSVQLNNSEQQIANMIKSGQYSCSWMRGDLQVDKGAIFYDYYLDGLKQEALAKGNCMK